ncbi:MAG: sigma-54 interaction domain-containing protein [Gemmatimonadales bacterium]
MELVRVCVVRLSESFGDLWDRLSADAGADECFHVDQHEDVLPSAVAAVILAAGGAELEVVEWLSRHGVPGVPVLAVGANEGRRIATQIVARGAEDYFALPADLEILGNTLSAAVRRYRDDIRAEESSATARDDAFAEMIGRSPALRDVIDRAAKLVPHKEANVLIVGETGTGKELLASAIHRAGPQRGAPFVPVNCSALPDQLIESELFGHERGAFTDAKAAKPGLFEMADGGTLFLDEVATLPVELQAKLLRVLQDNQVRRVGGTRLRKVDVRIIAATNQDLTVAIQDGSFREDLYYRLAVITLKLPPLRQRGDDIVLIAEVLLERLAAQHGLKAPTLTEEMARRLLSYHWPGNVRELRNSVERSLLLSPPGTLDPAELSFTVSKVNAEPDSEIPFPARLDEITRCTARAMLRLCAGNRSEAARRLDISRRRLRRLLEESGSDSPSAEVETV